MDADRAIGTVKLSQRAFDFGDPELRLRPREAQSLHKIVVAIRKRGFPIYRCGHQHKIIRNGRGTLLDDAKLKQLAITMRVIEP